MAYLLCVSGYSDCFPNGHQPPKPELRINNRFRSPEFLRLEVAYSAMSLLW
jgi:hypothetical protein